MLGVLHLIFGLATFVLGTVVGSFLNVCIYRVPWQKSVIWPDSRCPKCLGAIAARDNIPVLSWFVLRGECRWCGAAISPRYPAIEALVGLLFLGVYVVDVAWSPGGVVRMVPATILLRMVYHLILVALLVVASFIDIDLMIIPDEVTVPGILLGLALGTVVPEIRPEPATAHSFFEGFGVGAWGLIVGGGSIWLIRVVGGAVARREAMGFGDVTLLGLIGAFLGWQIAVLTIFVASFLGLAPAVAKIVVKIAKRVRGRQLSRADSELPFGPYLSLAAVLLLLGWPGLWGPNATGPVGRLLTDLSVVFWWMVGWET
jgi:leader peptidase (prepilin peptidase)/N-methyltransferase